MKPEEPAPQLKKPTKLREKQARFIDEYLKDSNGTQAAIRAGYSTLTAGQQSFALLNKPQIQEIVQAKRTEIANQNALTPARILEEWRRIALADVRGMYDEDGKLKPIHTLTAEQAAAIQGLDVVRENIRSGDGRSDQVLKIRLVDRSKALEALSKYFGLLTEKIEHSGSLVIRHELVTGASEEPKQLADVTIKALPAGNQDSLNSDDEDEDDTCPP